MNKEVNDEKQTDLGFGQVGSRRAEVRTDEDRENVRPAAVHTKRKAQWS